MSILDLGIPGVEAIEDEDFVHLRLGEQHRAFSACGVTLETLRENALEMLKGGGIMMEDQTTRYEVVVNFSIVTDDPEEATEVVRRLSAMVVFAKRMHG